jgi:hypothetical protein
VEDGDMLQPKVKHLNKGTLSFTKSTIKPINKTFVIDAELAYVFGRFAGDGSITIGKDTRHGLNSIWQIVGHEDEKEMLDHCADIIEQKLEYTYEKDSTLC